MIRRRLAASALTAGLGLVCCGCLSSLHGNGSSSCSSGGLFSFLHRNNTTVAECCPVESSCPTCAGETYEGPALEPPTATTVIPTTPAPATVVPVVPGTTMPSTAPPPRLVPTPATSRQMPWTP